MKRFDWDEIEAFLKKTSDSSKIYIGVDSVSHKRHGKDVATYYKVIVIHKECLHGCKIFGEVITENDYNINKKKPRYRLMQEVYKVAGIFIKLSELTEKDIEIHLDINPKKEYASSIIIDEAIGYIRGTCNVVPMIKPKAFAASYAADRLLKVKSTN